MKGMTWKEASPDGLPEPLAERTALLGWGGALSLALDWRPGIRISGGAMRTIREHIDHRPVEVGGLLLGSAVARPGSGCRERYPYATCVSLAIPAKQTSDSPVSLTMAASVWDEARRIAPELRVVGWFHSHPNLGAFFSATDRFTQRHFFRLPHQIGLVIDPFREEMACFAGPDSEEVATSIEEPTHHPKGHPRFAIPVENVKQSFP